MSAKTFLLVCSVYPRARKKQKANSLEVITWAELGKQITEAKKSSFHHFFPFNSSTKRFSGILAVYNCALLKLSWSHNIFPRLTLATRFIQRLKCLF